MPIDPEVIETATVIWRLSADGILHGLVKSSSPEDTLATAKENIDALERLAAGRLLPVFVDVRKVRTLPRETRLAYAKDTAAFNVATALLVESAFSWIVANFVILLTNPAKSFRLFTDEEEALEWLRTFL
ncbi:MAG: hypothetical protein WCQ50_12450 [Spirochaetota bacterium]